MPRLRRAHSGRAKHSRRSQGKRQRRWATKQQPQPQPQQRDKVPPAQHANKTTSPHPERSVRVGVVPYQVHKPGFSLATRRTGTRHGRRKHTAGQEPGRVRGGGIKGHGATGTTRPTRDRQKCAHVAAGDKRGEEDGEKNNGDNTLRKRNNV